MEWKDELNDKLQKLKRNREQIEEEILQSKYKSGYERLKNEIFDLYKRLVFEYCIRGSARFLKDDTVQMQEYRNKCNSIVAEHKTEVMKGFQILMETYDCNNRNIYNSLYGVMNACLYQAYVPYWISKCEYIEKGVRVPLGDDVMICHYRNKITGRLYYDEGKFWFDWENGEITISTYLPPTMEEAMEEYSKCRESQAQCA